MYQRFCAGMLIEAHAAMLTKAAHTPLYLAWHQPKVDFHKPKVSLYRKECKSGFNWPWLGRAVRWKSRKRNANYTLEWSILGIFCSCFKKTSKLPTHNVHLQLVSIHVLLDQELQTCMFVPEDTAEGHLWWLGSHMHSPVLQIRVL